MGIVAPGFTIMQEAQHMGCPSGHLVKRCASVFLVHGRECTYCKGLTSNNGLAFLLLETSHKSQQLGLNSTIFMSSSSTFSIIGMVCRQVCSLNGWANFRMAAIDGNIGRQEFHIQWPVIYLLAPTGFLYITIEILQLFAFSTPDPSYSINVTETNSHSLM